MANYRDTKSCKKHKVAVCLIEDKINAKRAEHLIKYGRTLSIPRAIVQLILDK